MATRLPASERTREEQRDLIEGRLASSDERSALLRLATRLIIEEAWRWKWPLHWDGATASTGPRPAIGTGIGPAG